MMNVVQEQVWKKLNFEIFSAGYILRHLKHSLQYGKYHPWHPIWPDLWLTSWLTSWSWLWPSSSFKNMQQLFLSLWAQNERKVPKMRTHESSLPQARTTSIKDQMKYTLCRMVLTNRCLPEPPEHRHGHSSHEKTNHCKEQRSECPGFYVIPLNSINHHYKPRIWVVEVELWSFLTLCGGAHVSHFPNPALVAVEMKIMIIMITPHWWRWSPWSSWSNLLAFHLRLAELKVVARRALPTTLLCVWNLVFIIFSGKSW